MHLLYLDDSGSVNNASEDYIVLGGVSISEHQCHFLTTELDNLAKTIDPVNFNDIEFHASEIFSRRSSPWDKLTKEEAQGIIKAVLRVVVQAHDSAKIFACAIHKKSYLGNNTMNMAFEDLTKRFDNYLKMLYSGGDRQKGLLILDDSAHETTLMELARNFRQTGTQWGSIKNIADTPFFVSSKSSRVIQIADHIAYSVFRRYNHSDAQYFDIIAERFHSVDHIIHGLAHKQKLTANCMCPACHSRRFDKGEDH